MGGNLKSLNLSRNNISSLPDCCSSLNDLFAGTFSKNLLVLDLSSNGLADFSAVTKKGSLEKLQLSGNQIEYLPESLSQMRKLKFLYLGFNKINCLIEAIGASQDLKVLALNNNKLSSVKPSTMVNLRNLTTLHLHYNQISALPRVLIDGLPGLKELSLRGNPLIDKFVRKRLMEGRKHTAPSLFELACRAIKNHEIAYSSENFSPYIMEYLDMARKCPNPNCCGVYFDKQYSQVKFVDTCGAYRLPLLQYLCSPNCFEASDPVTSSGTESSSNSNDETSESDEVEAPVVASQNATASSGQRSNPISAAQASSSPSSFPSSSLTSSGTAAAVPGTISIAASPESDIAHTGLRRSNDVANLRVRVVVGGYNYTTEEIVGQIENLD